MRKLMLILALIAFNSNAEKINCVVVESMAKDTMFVLQQGGTAIDLMKASAGSELAKLMIRDAFDTPMYYSEENKKQATTDFANKWYLACLDVDA